MAEPYLRNLTELVAALDLGPSESLVLECRHFFSGAALYANGKICASLTPAGLGLKLPPEARERLIAEGAGAELRYFEHAPEKKAYVALAGRVTRDPDRLKALFEQSLAFVIGRE